MGALVSTQPCRPFSANSCPGQPKSRQLAGGHASTLLVRSPSSGSIAFAPRSHMAVANGCTPSSHRSNEAPFFTARYAGLPALAGWGSS
eukprot:4620056-Pyramimonas_sp.AAC.2